MLPIPAASPIPTDLRPTDLRPTGPIPTDELVRARLSSMDQATAVLNTHVPTEAGLCGGCLEVWSRWVPATGCTQLAWARSVVETHGVGDDAWDLPVVRRYAGAIAS